MVVLFHSRGARDLEEGAGGILGKEIPQFRNLPLASSGKGTPHETLRQITSPEPAVASLSGFCPSTGRLPVKFLGALLIVIVVGGQGNKILFGGGIIADIRNAALVGCGVSLRCSGRLAG